MTTPTVRLKRRHHQPLARRFEEECHLLWRQSLRWAQRTIKLWIFNCSNFWGKESALHGSQARGRCDIPALPALIGPL